jgi:hypothetical protein
MNGFPHKAVGLERLKKYCSHSERGFLEFWRGFGEGTGSRNPVTEPKRRQKPKRPLLPSSFTNGYSIFEYALIALVWLAVSMAAEGQVRMAAAPQAQRPPPEIKLNGLTTILGDKRALFKVRYDSGQVESYFLAEGQCAGAIKLLFVDIRAGTIKVNSHGVTQTASLCDPPDLSILMASEIGGEKTGSSFSRQNIPGNSSAVSVQGGSPTAGGGTSGQNFGEAVPAGKSATGTANSSPGDTGSRSSGNPGKPDDGSQNSGGAGSGNTAQLPEPFALRAAREFERLRIESASGVYNGNDEPLPLTPLTPPGTPKALIGPDRAWFPPDSTFDP